jgi:hypothetical protein
MPEGSRIIGSVFDGAVFATVLAGFTLLSQRGCKVGESIVVFCNTKNVVSG